MSAAVTGVELGMAVRQVVEQLTARETALHYKIPMCLGQDNLARVQTITHEVTPWRTRHYASRAAWIRDMVVEEYLEVRHERGLTILADGLTKVLARHKLADTGERLQLARSALLRSL